MITGSMTYREICELPLLRDLAPYFITKMDLSKEDHYSLSLDEFYKNGGWNSDSIVYGLNRLCRNLETGHCRYPLYTAEEIAAEPEKKDPFLLFFPSDDPEADNRPYIFVVPGGAYINVWSLTEGYPVATRFNEQGYHCFLLNYRVSVENLFPRPLEDIARALTLIRDSGKEFPVQWDNYAMVGFSAGANLILNWSLKDHGYPVYGMPSPQVLMPIYAPVSWSLHLEDGEDDWLTRYAFGVSSADAVRAGWNVNEHVEGFPPCYLCCCADDDLVDPEHSRLLKKALDAAGIASELEIGAHGGHGFAEGRDADTKGWIERAAAFIAKYTKE